ncbi:MAG: NUDIX hydrolase [Halobacteriales archaeon]
MLDQSTYVVNVEGAVVKDNQYLLIERAAADEHASGALAFPGGKVEVKPGVSDPIEATVRRELMEEVGIRIGEVEYIRSRTFETDTGSNCLNIVTYCKYTGGEPWPREPDEVADIVWMTPEEIAVHDEVPDFLKRDVERIESVR